MVWGGYSLSGPGVGVLSKSMISVAGTKGSGGGGELRHLAGSPAGGGVIRSCHTLVRVNAV